MIDPIEMTVEYLCKKDAELLLAKKLRDQATLINLSLLEKFEARIQERINPDLVHLIHYLKSTDF